VSCNNSRNADPPRHSISRTTRKRSSESKNRLLMRGAESRPTLRQGPGTTDHSKARWSAACRFQLHPLPLQCYEQQARSKRSAGACMKAVCARSPTRESYFPCDSRGNPPNTSPDHERPCPFHASSLQYRAAGKRQKSAITASEALQQSEQLF